MKVNLVVNRAVHFAILSGAGVALALPAAFAQDAPQNVKTANQGQSGKAAIKLGTVSVTGTRILRTSTETAQPVTIISAKQIKASGLTTIGAVLQNMTQSGAAVNKFDTGGQAQIDLRYFGSNRVLVLVNGHRWVSNLNGSVDLTAIPASIIDHVEILQDGASAIYGSDAITGVINIITVKNFNGAEANAYMGVYQNDYDGLSGWDGKEQSYSITLGNAGARSGVILNASYTERDGIGTLSRAQFVDPAFTMGKAAGQIYTTKGVFIIDTGKPFENIGQATCDATGVCTMTLTNVPTEDPTLGNFKNYVPSEDNDLPQPVGYVMPSERESLYLQGHYDIADNLTFTTTGMANVRNSSAVYSPAYTPILTGESGAATVEDEGFGIGANNPYNPFHKDLVASASQYCPSGTLVGGPNAGNTCTPNLLLSLYARSFGESPRVFKQHVKTLSFNMGLKGFFDALGSEWDWDLNSTYGNADAEILTEGSFDGSQMAEQLDAPGWAQCNGPGQATKPVGQSVEVGGIYYPILIPNCVPMNLFGGYNQLTGQGSITPAMLAYSRFTRHDLQSNTVRDYEANITGNLFNLPAGPLAIATGVEYLENDDSSTPDFPVILGNIDETPSAITQGRQRTNAEYVEINIPMLSDVPLAKSLSMDLANRWSQFKWTGGVPNSSEFGVTHNANATTARAQLRWQPTRDLLLRASWAQGFRAPDLQELYAGVGSGYPFVEDPCAPSSHFGGWTAGTPLPVGCHGLEHTQPFNQIEDTTGGNPSLSPEHAISKSAGFVYNPSWIPGFDISADYYKIDLLDSIGPIGAQFIMDECYIQNDPAYCSRISMSTAGETIHEIRAGQANTGEEYSRGVDVSAHYRLPATAIGDFSLATNWTFVQSFVQVFSSPTSPTGWASSENRGLDDMPQRKGNVSLNWSSGNWSAHWHIQYIGPIFTSCSGLNITDNNCTDPNSTYTYNGQQTAGEMLMGTTIYHDVSATYHMASISTDFTLGIRNLFNKQFPCGPESFTGCSFVNTIGYRAPGRFFYAQVGVKF